MPDEDKTFGVSLVLVKSAYEPIVANKAGAHPGFCSMKWLGVFLLLLDGVLVHRRVTPSIKFAGTHLYTWVESQEHNTMSSARAWTGPLELAPESSAITMRPPRLPHLEWKFIGIEFPVPFLFFGCLYMGILGFKLNGIFARWIFGDIVKHGLGL